MSEDYVTTHEAGGILNLAPPQVTALAKEWGWDVKPGRGNRPSSYPRWQVELVRDMRAACAPQRSAPVKYSKPLDTSQQKMRKCLPCGVEFLSSGPGNRMCESCRYTSGFRDLSINFDHTRQLEE